MRDRSGMDHDIHAFEQRPPFGVAADLANADPLKVWIGGLAVGRATAGRANAPAAFNERPGQVTPEKPGRPGQQHRLHNGGMNVREAIVTAIVERLHQDAERIRQEFFAPGVLSTRFAIVDRLLPDDLAHRIFAAFPPVDRMRLLDSFREKKFTSKALDTHDPLIADITFAFQDPRVVQAVADLTGIREPHADPKLYAGGISVMTQGHFLNPHLDNSHDFEQKHYRVLNLLYYCSPDWKTEDGGNFELWNEAVTEAVEIPSLFNRLVLMSTNDKSWHSVNPVKRDAKRCCVSNYYFSPHSPNGYETTHVTYFKARPEQTFQRIWTEADSRLRTLARIIKKRGFSRKDIFEQKK